MMPYLFYVNGYRPFLAWCACWALYEWLAFTHLLARGSKQATRMFCTLYHRHSADQGSLVVYTYFMRK
jgi:hypothetical protein